MAREKSATIVESELYARLSLITGHGKDVVRDVIRALSEFVMDELKCETPVRLGSLGEITTITCRRNGGYDFAKKEKREAKMVRQAKFKPSITLRRAIRI